MLKEISPAPFGHFEMASPDEGADALRTIVLRAPGIEVHVSPFGATITRILVPDRDGVVADVALGYDDLESYDSAVDRPYFGAVVGRVANRIANARFEVRDENGSVVTRSDALVANNGPHCLHGGTRGFDRHWWAVASRSEDGTRCRLTRVSPDKEEGFPGACAAAVEYGVRADAVSGGACLHTTMTATVDAACPVNLAQHTYFNLAGHGASASDDENKRVDATAHVLRVDASRVAVVDRSCIPTGVLMDVKGTPFDFTAPRAIGASMPPVERPDDPGGFDHNFALNGAFPPESAASAEGAAKGAAETDVSLATDSLKLKRRRSLRVAAEAFEPRSGRRMVLECDAPGVQLYTGNFLNGQKGKGGAVYSKHAGFCLETQHFPDCVNQPKFESCVLSPGETYEHRMVHTFFAE